MSAVLSGNEAIARGAWEAGVKVATAYPGTPSTEIVQATSQYEEIHSEWCPNEKVALEVALGAAQGGGRALCAMKHVGLNVAADPLLTASYTGIRAGLVIVTADDPGMFSSQNEQDNRYYAHMAKIPCLEPSDSYEAYLFTQLAFELSERFDTPVLLRTTTRISHSAGIVATGKRTEHAFEPGLEKDRQKYVMIPAHARKRHEIVEERMLALKHWSEENDINRIEMGSNKLGVITGGVSYQYVKEVLPECSLLKLGCSHPVPVQLIKQFCSTVDHVLVVEELDPVWENQIKALCIAAYGKEVLPITGELSPDLILEAARQVTGEARVQPELVAPVDGLPVRPPVLCPGCPHRGVFYLLSKMKATVTGDIGCYTLGVQPPFNAIHTCTCMGAGIGQAMGMELAGGKEVSKNTFAVIGDSTFVHSGITGLIEVVYNRGSCNVLIMDNSTTAMTGHQPHPGTGKTAMGEGTVSLDYESLCQSLGLEHVVSVDPVDLDATRQALQDALDYDGPSVVITKRPCVLLDRSYRLPAVKVDSDECNACGVCLQVGCPAIEQMGPEVNIGGRTKRLMQINETLCAGCGVCQQVCPRQAIVGGESK